jgi:hypothetical protein
VHSDLVRHPTALIITIEGLGTNLVGAYGNSLCPTPRLDRFAARSLVADQFWMDGCDPTEVLISMWSGLHRCERFLNRDNAVFPHTPGIIRSPGLFITDSPSAIPIANQWLDGEALLASEHEPEATAFASLVQRAVEQWIPQLESFPWLWIHSRGLLSDWDAPYEYRWSMCDEGDPPPPRETNPPTLTIDDRTDPDIAFGWACGAGAQAMAIDEVWEWLLSALEELGLAENCLLGLAGVLGYPLGEHGQIGWPDQKSEHIDAPKLDSRGRDLESRSHLFAEKLHTPLILRPGGRLPLGIRLAPFIQPHHIALWIDSWLENDETLATPPGSTALHLDPCRDLDSLIALSGLRLDSWPGSHRAAVAIDGEHTAIMVPGWSALWDAQNNEIAKSMLFPMPDDRWQQNEIRSRAPEVLESIRQLKDRWLEALQTNPSEVSSVLGTMDEFLWRPDR